MACVRCEGGVWICEEGTTPRCTEQVFAVRSLSYETSPLQKGDAPATKKPSRKQVEVQGNWDYQGRYRVPKGYSTVWCRKGSPVAVSQTAPQPLPNPRPRWQSAGRICFPETADYDIWRKPESCRLMVVQVANTTTNEECEPPDPEGD